MKKHLYTLRRLLAKTALFIGLLLILYSLFASVLFVHYSERTIDRWLSSEKRELRETLTDLETRKDSLTQKALAGWPDVQLFQEILQTDSLIEETQTEHDRVYGSWNKRETREALYGYMRQWPTTYAKAILAPSLMYLPLLCLALAFGLYKLVRPLLVQRFPWLSLET